MPEPASSPPPRPAWWPARFQALWEFLNRDVWSAELTTLPTFRKLAYKVARVAYLAGSGFSRDRCMFRASGLAFITVLSLVPLLAVAFSVAKGFGAYDALEAQVIEPFLERNFEFQSGADGHEPTQVREAIDRVLALVENTNVGQLGIAGVLVLVYTVIKLLSSIEQSFNDIWGIHRSRTLLRRVSDYISLLVTVPVLLLAANVATSALTADAAVGWLPDSLDLGPVVDLGVRAATLLVIWGGFSLLYLFMPNTRVRLPSALLGGLVGGLLWQVLQVMHVQFQVGVARYNALYAGVAAVPIFLIWMYLSWVTVLLGAEVAAAHQSESAYRQMAKAREFDHAQRETVAVRVAARVAAAFVAGRPAYRADGLAEVLAVPARTINEVLEGLVGAGLFAFAEDAEGLIPPVLPARDLDRVTLQDVLDGLQERRGAGGLEPVAAGDDVIDRALGRYDLERRSLRANITLRELGERLEGAGGQAADQPADQPAGPRPASRGGAA